MFRGWWVIAALLLSGCANLGCGPACGAHARNSSSLVEFLYPQGAAPPARNAVPELRIPLRVGLAFLPSNGGDATGGLDVVDPSSRSLVLRAGGTSIGHGNTTWVDAERLTRETAVTGYDAATDQMIEHFDQALTQFEADVRSGNAAVKVVRKNDLERPARGGLSGIGAVSWPTILALFAMLGFRRISRIAQVA